LETSVLPSAMIRAFAAECFAGLPLLKGYPAAFIPNRSLIQARTIFGGLDNPKLGIVLLGLATRCRVPVRLPLRSTLRLLLDPRLEADSDRFCGR